MDLRRPLFGAVAGAMLFTGGTLLLSSDARASSAEICGTRDFVADQLKKSYNEVLVSSGIDFKDKLVEIYASPEGSWTMVATQKGGQACVVTAGKQWQGLKTQLLDKPI